MFPPVYVVRLVEDEAGVVVRVRAATLMQTKTAEAAAARVEAGLTDPPSAGNGPDGAT